MTTLLEEATLQFLNESQGLFDMMPMFGIDAGDIILQIKQSANALSELSKEPKWQKVCTVFIEKGEKDPSWWRTPLGNYTAQNMPIEDKTITKAEAAKILDVKNATVATLVRRGTLRSDSGNPFLSDVLERMLSPKKAGRPCAKTNGAQASARVFNDRVKPILKWAGGKSQMLDVLLPKVPAHYGKYIEPFFGGGALFFALRPENAVIADSNPELVNLYTQVRDHVVEVIAILTGYKNEQEQFLKVRSLDWTKLSPVEAAARTIYLNKTCFNGLYRVNRKGQFNTPFGKYKNPKICDTQALREASKALQNATIVCGDYAAVLAEYAEPDDFVFLDPPYIPVSEYSDFKRYTKEQFEISDHSRLAVEFSRLHSLGCHLMLTNSNHPLVHDLYGQYEIQVIPTKRSVACRASSRTGEDTLIIAEPEPKTLAALPEKKNLSKQVELYPPTRFMGSKQKLLTELWNVASRFNFNSVVDLFSGSGIVSYMFKAQGKQVISNDYMAMSATFTKAMVENQNTTLPLQEAKALLKDCPTDDFVSNTFRGLYYTDEENHLIDVLRTRIKNIEYPYQRAIAMTALIRACTKKRPRGIFTYTGHRYDDGRKDLKKTLAEQFLEAIEAVNNAVFDNHQPNKSIRGDALLLETNHPDLVYMDPPYYSPLSDNEYVRRYHFVEGLACDWQGVTMQEHTKTKKFKSYPTPFSSRTGAADAFDKLIERFKDSILIISYSSNSQPTKEEMLRILGRHKKNVEVVPVDYRYSIGTQHKGAANRNKVEEYFFLGW
ncbi:Dam family site-specific DNA-(adenine-N6)-methyltransferase [Bifidobacterium pseudocatenulatum]|jgi:DNA adenine methylase|uniref:Dam family site-specific DNA-(adenine-N6)-methyltransferase n=1 Tax=Bifidobacterium pseudocatenulatum TaxID=28026 RepID=UPI000B271665|nr:Dam family site-specific DNA-(adenine-N6)-methyltransferase [Bifidobacterium pseudocatenulatum]MCB4867785.1 Dam family site-specific DNA-(adenine-N6)-methyltransferase [Bifidobacterium pseudocatenulatum]